jgi:hypothetical protein
VSEASRHRYLLLRNRLEELFALYGAAEEPPPMGAECEPTWGPLGSLARQAWGDDAVEALLAMDREMARRGPAQGAHATPPAEHPSQATEQLPPQNHVLEASAAMRRLDKHGETPLFGCPSCGEESAKASVPLDLWHCTACNTSGRASRLPGVPGDQATPVHIV